MAYSKTKQKDDIQALLKINHDLERFIRDSIGASLNVEKWSSLYKEFKPIKCWEIKGCRKIKCPSYKSEDYRCWLKVGTFCDGAVQGEFAKKYISCFSCEVFNIISEEPVRALYENINTLVYHLKNREDKLHELAIKDNLTGRYNRHFFNEVIEREIARIERSNEVVSFIMIDLDGLKQINDNLGHLTGDKILVECAELINKTARKSDIVFRFGGDEFLVLLANADCEKTTVMIKRLLEKTQKWNMENAEEYGCRLSFSIGCSTCKNCHEILKTLNEADKRMYQNKKYRKNKINVLL